MTKTFNFVIRDAVEADIHHCVALDASYETLHVWRTNMQEESDGWRVAFRKERLPRSAHHTHPVDKKRLELALPHGHCFLVASVKNPLDAPLILGYLTLRFDPIHYIGLIQDIVVAQDFRQQGIGARLLSVARLWAAEKDAKTIMVEVPTKNYPAINFLQNRGFRFCGFNDQYFTNRDISVFFGQSLR